MPWPYFSFHSSLFVISPLCLPPAPTLPPSLSVYLSPSSRLCIAHPSHSFCQPPKIDWLQAEMPLFPRLEPLPRLAAPHKQCVSQQANPTLPFQSRIMSLLFASVLVCLLWKSQCDGGVLLLDRGYFIHRVSIEYQLSLGSSCTLNSWQSPYSRSETSAVWLMELLCQWQEGLLLAVLGQRRVQITLTSVKLFPDW